MPSSRSERQRKAEPCARRCARVSSVEPPSMTRNSYSSFPCERTEATVAAIFAPLLKVGVMTDISGGFMTNVQSCSDSTREKPVLGTSVDLENVPNYPFGFASPIVAHIDEQVFDRPADWLLE